MNAHGRVKILIDKYFSVRMPCISLGAVSIHIDMCIITCHRNYSQVRVLAWIFHSPFSLLYQHTWIPIQAQTTHHRPGMHLRLSGLTLTSLFVSKLFCKLMIRCTPTGCTINDVSLSVREFCHKEIKCMEIGAGISNIHLPYPTLADDLSLIALSIYVNRKW